MAEFQMYLPRLDVPVRPPPVEHPLPLSAAEEAKRRPEPAKKCFVWSEYKNSGFPSRVNHAAAAYEAEDGNRYMYSIGGYHATEEERAKKREEDEASPHFNTGPIDVHYMDVDTRQWEELKVIARTKDRVLNRELRGVEPPRRYGHACVQYDGKIFMYGGRNDDDGSFKVIECLDVKRNMWLKVKTKAIDCKPPSTRDGHCCSNIGKDMYMHGGFDTHAVRFTSDLYQFDMDTYTWRLLPEKGAEVTQRDFHSAVCLTDRIVVFGGRSDLRAPHFSNQDIYDSFFYEYLLEEQKWVKIEAKGYQPRGRRSLSYARYGDNKVIYFGGFNNRIKRHFNDIFIYDSSTRHVTEIIPYGTVPCARRRAAACLIGSEFIICGGTSPIAIGGKQDKLMLRDHDDMYILSLLPSLQHLCMLVIKELKLSTAALPIFMRQELAKFNSVDKAETK